MRLMRDQQGNRQRNRLPLATMYVIGREMMLRRREIRPTPPPPPPGRQQQPHIDRTTISCGNGRTFVGRRGVARVVRLIVRLRAAAQVCCVLAPAHFFSFRGEVVSEGGLKEHHLGDPDGGEGHGEMGRANQSALFRSHCSGGAAANFSPARPERHSTERAFGDDDAIRPI